MNVTILDKQIAALREHDDAVSAGLTELDEKFGAWLNALRDVQATVSACAAAAEAAPAAAADVVESTVVEPLAAVPEGPVADESIVVEPLAAVPEEPVAAVTAVEPDVEPEEAAPVVEPDDADAGRGMFRRRGAESDGQEATPGTASDLSAEDEALLAGLDPKTANQIRVKRRLTGNRRSVRDLLSELEPESAASGKSDGQVKRGKRWWRRGDG